MTTLNRTATRASRILAARSAATRVPALVALVVFLFAVYLFAIRPAQLHWGATSMETERSMAGDDLVSSPSFCATRGITIRGTPAEIWPWLVQMGYGRAGFYGYDLIENLGSTKGIRSAQSILPELQNPKTGDVLPISAVASVVFDSVHPGSYLIWRGGPSPSNGSFAWSLYPIDGTHTRLISRIRLRYHWTDRRLLLDLFTEFADHVAVPKILLGIRERVEERPIETLAEEAAEIFVWMLALAGFATAAVLLFRCRRWGRAWFLGLAAGLVLLFALYARESLWTGAGMSCAVLAGMFLISRGDSAPSSEV